MEQRNFTTTDLLKVMEKLEQNELEVLSKYTLDDILCVVSSKQNLTKYLTGCQKDIEDSITKYKIITATISKLYTLLECLPDNSVIDTKCQKSNNKSLLDWYNGFGSDNNLFYGTSVYGGFNNNIGLKR